MLLEIGNVMDKIGVADAVCITTNGFVKNNGECVMGRGIALEMKKKYTGIAKRLGSLITKHGNRCMFIGKVEGTRLTSFPVKHNWWEKADLSLIEKSCKELMQMADKFELKNVILPRPGCGNGKLEWSEVYPILEEYLDDRFKIMSFNASDFHINGSFDYLRDDHRCTNCKVTLTKAELDASEETPLCHGCALKYGDRC